MGISALFMAAYIIARKDLCAHIPKHFAYACVYIYIRVHTHERAGVDGSDWAHYSIEPPRCRITHRHNTRVRLQIYSVSVHVFARIPVACRNVECAIIVFDHVRVYSLFAESRLHMHWYMSAFCT